MDEELKAQLISAGWKSGNFRGFYLSRRAGIDFQVGPSRASRADPEAGARLELRYSYHTDQTHVDAEEVLPAGSMLTQIEDRMTAIYLRIHERPDPTRVFGSRRRSTTAPRQTLANRPSLTPVSEGETEEVETGQGAFDL
jgi:hypothetical protein